MFKTIKVSVLSFILASLIIPSVSFAQTTGATVSDVDTSGGSSCITIDTNLSYKNRKNNNKDDVMTLQDFLNSIGYLKAESVTGFFGKVTESAVAKFQKNNGLVATPPGFVGAGTRAKIHQLSCDGITNTTLVPSTQPSVPRVSAGNLPVGCTSVYGFSPITGQSCSATPVTVKPICNSEQYLQNGVCKDITQVCPDGRVIPGMLSCNAPVICTMEYRSCPNGSPMPRDASCVWHAEQCANVTTPTTSDAPYVSSAVSDANGIVTVTGQRLDMSGNYLQIDGMGNSMISKFNPTSNSFQFDSKNYQLTNGSHTLLITNSQTGNSNSFSFDVKVSNIQIPPTPTPTPTTSTIKTNAIAVGVYEGEYIQGGNEGFANITIPSSAEGKVLVLSSYSRVTWVVVNPYKVTLKKIIIAGYYEQHVSGDIVGIPVESYSLFTTPSDWNYVYNTTSSVDSVITSTRFNSFIAWLYKKNIILTSDNFYHAYRSSELPSFIAPNPTAKVNNLSVPIINFTASPTSVTAGQPTLLTWDAKNALSCYFKSPAPINMPLSSVSGTQFVYLSNTTQIDLICRGDVNATSSVTVSVVPVVRTVTPETLGLFGAYADGQLVWQSATTTTKAVALERCAGIKASFNQRFLSCLWNWEEIYTYERDPVAAPRLEAIGFGAYQGLYATSSLSNQTNGSEGVATITIPSSAQGKVLVFTGYEPINWIISNPNKVIIPKIITIGYNSQRVTGDISGIPIENNSFKTNYIYSSPRTVQSDGFQKLVYLLKTMGVNLIPDNFQGAYYAYDLPAYKIPPTNTTTPQTPPSQTWYSQSVLGDFISNATCTNLPRNLIRGIESATVTDLQNFMIEKGLLVGPSTGFYGDKTVEAVKDYQATKGLPITGMVYGFTREAIRAESCR